MKTKYDKTIAWVLGDGREVKVEIGLLIEQDLWADGYPCTGACCNLMIDASIGGGVCFERLMQPKQIGDKVIVASIGRLGIPEPQAIKIEAAIAAIEASPEWIAKLAQQAEAEKIGREMDARKEKMRKLMEY